MKPLAKLAWVETKLFLRDPMAMIFTFAFPFFVLIVLAGVFGNEIDPADQEEVEAWRGVGPTDYYVPAYIGLVMASIGLIVLPLRLASYREAGILRRFRAAGMPLVAVVGSQAVVAFGLSIIGAVTIVALGIVAYGTMLPEQWPGVIGAFLLSAACFIAIGVALGSVLPTARAAQGAGLILFFVMMFLSGAGPPREVLGDAMRRASDALPLTHVVLLLQDPWLGFGWDRSASLVVIAFAVGASLVTLRFFRWSR